MSVTDDQPATTTMSFGGLDIRYDHRVLEPRPWTAAQSRWAAELLGHLPAGPVLELCTGAGQIGLLAILDCDRQLVAVDADPVACDYARRNAEAAGIADRVDVRQATLEEALGPDEMFPMVIADPPWVPSARTSGHPDDPLNAIDGGFDGLEVARRCLAVASEHLVAGGVMLLQLGTPEQADVLATYLPVDNPGLTVEEIRQPDATGVVVAIRQVTEQMP